MEAPEAFVIHGMFVNPYSLHELAATGGAHQLECRLIEELEPMLAGFSGHC